MWLVGKCLCCRCLSEKTAFRAENASDDDAGPAWPGLAAAAGAWAASWGQGRSMLVGSGVVLQLARLSAGTPQTPRKVHMPPRSSSSWVSAWELTNCMRVCMWLYFIYFSLFLAKMHSRQEGIIKRKASPWLPQTPHGCILQPLGCAKHLQSSHTVNFYGSTAAPSSRRAMAKGKRSRAAAFPNWSCFVSL